MTFRAPHLPSSSHQPWGAGGWGVEEEGVVEGCGEARISSALWRSHHIPYIGRTPHLNPPFELLRSRPLSFHVTQKLPHRRNAHSGEARRLMSSPEMNSVISKRLLRGGHVCPVALKVLCKVLQRERERERERGAGPRKWRSSIRSLKVLRKRLP